MIISDIESRSNPKPDPTPQKGDLLNLAKFNALAGPVTARMCGGGEWWIETLDVQTSLMRIYVSGQLERREFCEVMMLIDIDGNEHDPEEFWMDWEPEA